MAFLTVSELAEHEGVTLRVVNQWIKEGLPTERGPNYELIVDLDEAEAWLNAEDGDEDEDDEDDE